MKMMRKATATECEDGGGVDEDPWKLSENEAKRKGKLEWEKTIK
jgi:hypothetical protein